MELFGCIKMDQENGLSLSTDGTQMVEMFMGQEGPVQL
jgi:hypothetical protein